MKKNKKIVLTGARGFIGSNLAEKLNIEGYTQLVLVDELENENKNINLNNVDFIECIHRDHFKVWFELNAQDVNFVYHLGARTDTAEFDVALFDKLNFDYSKMVWRLCVDHQIPLVYASSAATYGDGAYGYDDYMDISLLKPLNPYGDSKQNFDLWVQKQKDSPPFFAGLKFFNVYGKGEWHKNRMASVVLHAFRQINETKKMKLFQSHHENFQNGEQKRDFIYVKDLVDMCFFFQEAWDNDKNVENGLYNIGTGVARTFNDLVSATFTALNMKPNITYIPIPIDIRDKYQYYTQAKTNKIVKQGYSNKCYTLEEGVLDYVQNYLSA